MNFSKKIYKVFKSKFSFWRPPQKKYLILDGTNSFIFNEYLSKNEVSILDTRYESLNLYILLKLFFKFKFSFNDYINEYIKLSRCEFVISFFDNNVYFYQLKKNFRNKKFIIIQNGMRPDFFFQKLSKKKSLEVDYMLTFSDFYSKKFKENIEAKFITIGSFKNNNIAKKKLKENNIISFVSSGPSRADNITVFEKISLKNELYFYPETKLLPMISKFCDKNNYRLQILARSKNEKDFLYEKEFYNDILKSNKYDFIKTIHPSHIYEISDNSLLTISIYSAFGLEAIARGNRAVIFNLRDLASNIESLKLFWGYDKQKNKGPFWTNQLNENEVYRVLTKAIKSSDSEWNNYLKTIMPFLISKDEDNNFFKKILKNENI